MLKLTAKVKLQPTPEQHAALLQTLEAANAACNTISDVAWSERVFGRVPLHRLTYYDTKEAFGLSSQLVVRCIGKVVDAYKLDRQTKRTFRPHGAIAYDSRILRWFVTEHAVTIWTVAGRVRIPSFVASGTGNCSNRNAASQICALWAASSTCSRPARLKRLSLRT